MGTKVKNWVQDLTNEVCGPCLLQVGGRYRHPEDGPIEITSGQYWGTYGLSNFWYWTVLATGKKKNGYGGNWPPLD